MNEPPFKIPVLFNNIGFLDVLVDTGCDCYGAVSERAARKLGLELIPLPKPRTLGVAIGLSEDRRIKDIVHCKVDFDGWSCIAAFYVIPELTQDAILGFPWMRHRDVVVHANRRVLEIGAAGGLLVQESSSRRQTPPTELMIGAVYAGLARREARKKLTELRFASTSLRELTRVLSASAEGESTRTETPVLPKALWDFADLFDKTKADVLPPHRGDLDHHVRLKKDEDGNTPELPWGPLYSMPREHLLELRKQITELMDKGWIRASASSAAAPVLLVKKPGGNWRFCVDYRALNKVTSQDRYPLPLIKETLRSLSGARWFTKLDVRSAFHRIRMAEGQEHLTAFRTRFGLFEWLVCPFGLAGAPATFQRYINKSLGDALGDFVTAYLDDILIYSGGSRKDHMKKVRAVLERLRAAGLNLDLAKCAFAVTEVKYLGFIVEAGKAIRADPEKVAAIREWEAPRTVRGVRSFIGFANFYREFIPKFSGTAEPLIRLTKRNVPFSWGREESAAFETLKKAFIEYPVLAQWDPERETIVEADCSGRALGGCLSQVDGKGVLRPVAYHSAQLSQAERNYTIHDKELLAIISCLKAWTAELRGVARPFTILTDHKNLVYFMEPRLVSERQARWAELLSLFNYSLRYRPGSQAGRPDALSRSSAARDDDVPQMTQVLRPAVASLVASGPNVGVRPLGTDMEPSALRGPPRGSVLFSNAHLQQLWDEAVVADPTYQLRLKAVQDGERRFPKEARTGEQIANCNINAHRALTYKGRLWLPSWEPLTTAIIHQVHDQSIGGHPGKNTTFRLVSRDFHWDNMSRSIAQFVRNCHCYGGHVSRRRRQGLLQPLPIADQFWKQISIDFMVELPAKSSGGPRFLMVITDRLSKYVQLEAMESMTAEACAERFKTAWWRFHGFPSNIITDRGSDWVGHFWSTLCGLVGVKQDLSTAYHPQTDGGTERANQEVQAILRMVVCFEQDDWPDHLAATQLALNNRDSSVTGVSPNRLINGFDVDTIQMAFHPETSRLSPKGRAVAFLNHLKEGIELTQSAIAFAQQRQREGADRSRRPAERFKVGDKVWLSLRNIKTNRPSRKLDWLYAKYEVTAVPTPLTVTLDVPGELHKTFHVDLIERAADDPLPSQVLADSRPGPAWVLSPTDGTLREEWGIEAIRAAKNARGRGKRQVLVKWRGYTTETWEPLEAFKDTAALAAFEEKWGDARTHNGPDLGRGRPVNLTTTKTKLPDTTSNYSCSTPSSSCPSPAPSSWSARGLPPNESKSSKSSSLSSGIDSGFDWEFEGARRRRLDGVW